MTDLLSLFQTFTRVVEAGSFTAVARELDTSQPTVSRQVAALEEHLGCVLVQRTTRALALTDDGRTFYEHARRTLEAAAEAQGAVGRRRGRPSGQLKLACSGVFGRLHVLPHLRGFRERFPDVEVSLVMNDAFADLVEEGIDLAIRIGDTPDSALVTRRIGTTRRVVVATRDYLARRGTPRHPGDLRQHDCIVYDRLLTGASWPFVTPEGVLSVPVTGPVRVNNTEAVRTCILEGLGIGYVPSWHFIDGEIESGTVQVLLQAFEAPQQPICAVYPSRRFLAPKVRVAIEHFAGCFAREPCLAIAGA